MKVDEDFEAELARALAKVVKYIEPIKVAKRCAVDQKAVARWALRGFVANRKLPGPQGHWRIGVDDEGWPVDLPIPLRRRQAA